MSYNDDFYRNRNARTRHAALTILGLVRAAYPYTSVIDVGCGVGAWLSASLDLGAVHAEGVEGTWLRDAYITDTRINIRRQDLKQAVTSPRRFDMCISLEVAEHLPTSRAESFVADLCRLAPCVLFSAAMPGQTGGVDHINLQWQSWWVEKFRARSYLPLDLVRPRVWHETGIPVWYRQNTLLYVSPEVPNLHARAAAADAFIADVVHPEMFKRYFRESSPIRRLLRKAQASRCNGE